MNKCARCGNQIINTDHVIVGLAFPLCDECYNKYVAEEKLKDLQFVGAEAIEEGTKLILEGLQRAFEIDVEDVNFKDTPKRVARAYMEICSGAFQTSKRIEQLLATGFPAEGYQQMIICKDIKTFGLCPHHLLPVEYEISIGYIPEQTVLGISKLARIADICARQPLMQETVTQQIGDALKTTKPKGVIVAVKGSHYCMKMRGANQGNSTMITSYVDGVFYSENTAKEEFYNNLKL